MALLQAVYIFVFVLHNFICCSKLPLVLSPRDFLTTDVTKSIEIVTPISNTEREDVSSREEEISTQMTSFPYEINLNPTIGAHFPTEMPTVSTEIATPPNIENKTKETFGNKFGHRLPKFFGRLAVLAGLRLAEELANGASIDFTLKDNLNSAPIKLPSTKLSPYFAAVYEPFPLFPQTYVYSNLLGLIPLLNAMNSQKIPTENNISGTENIQDNVQTINSSSDETGSEDFHVDYISENRKNENATIEKRLTEKAVMEKKELQKNLPGDKTRENKTSETSEELGNEDEFEDIEESNEESNEENFNHEESNVDELVPTMKAPTPKVNKTPPVKSLTQKRPPATKRPIKKKTTMHPIMDNMTTMNSTNVDNTTQDPIQNNTDYPYHPGYYYGGHPQDVHNLYITSSEHPPSHDSYNYNEINHFPGEWSNNGNHETHYFRQYQYEIPSLGEEPIIINDPQSFRGSPILEPKFTNNGFRPNFLYSQE